MTLAAAPNRRRTNHQTNVNPEVVLVEDLAPIIQRLIDEWNSSIEPPAAMTFLQELSGVPTRLINRILSYESATVSLATADKVLTALDTPLTYLEQIGDLTVYRRNDLNEALREQVEIMMMFAHWRGMEVPAPGTKERRTWAEKTRRSLSKAARAA